MKAFAVILIVLVLAAVCAVGYLYLNAGLDVRFVSCIATDGVSQVEFFDDLRSRVENGSFTGTRLTNDLPGTADQYQFLTYTVRLDNHSFLNAEVLEIRITPMQGDVLQLETESETDLPAGRQVDISATILTDRAMHSVREATVSYYVWGIPFTEKITLGN